MKTQSRKVVLAVLASVTPLLLSGCGSGPVPLFNPDTFAEEGANDLFDFLFPISTDLSASPVVAEQAAGRSYEAVTRARTAEIDVEVSVDDMWGAVAKVEELKSRSPAGGGSQTGDTSESVLSAGEAASLAENVPLRKDPAEDQSTLSPIPSPVRVREEVKEQPLRASLRLTQAVAELAAGNVEGSEDAKGTAAGLYLLLDTTGDPWKEYLGDYLIQLTFALLSAEQRDGRGEVFNRLLAESCAHARLWEETYPSTPLGIANVNVLDVYETEPGCQAE